MRYGVARMPEGVRKQRLSRYLEQVLREPLAVLPYDREAALRHAAERARLTSQDRTPPCVDGRIAAPGGPLPAPFRIGADGSSRAAPDRLSAPDRRSL